VSLGKPGFFGHRPGSPDDPQSALPKRLCSVDASLPVRFIKHDLLGWRTGKSGRSTTARYLPWRWVAMKVPDAIMSKPFVPTFHQCVFSRPDRSNRRSRARAARRASRWRVSGEFPGYTLIRPGGRACYPAVWTQDFAVTLATGFVTSEEMWNHLRLSHPNTRQQQGQGHCTACVFRYRAPRVGNPKVFYCCLLLSIGRSSRRITVNLRRVRANRVE